VNVLESLTRRALEQPELVAHEWRGRTLTFAQLWSRATALGTALERSLGDSREPVVVFGHKHPDMLTCMLACLLTGHPYVPVDSSLPADRVRSILTASAAGLVLAPEDADRIGETPPGTVVWESADLERVCSPPTASDASDGSDAGSSSPGAPRATAPDEAQYIIFTSGSTGTPKGVQIARSSVDRFTGWLVDLVSGHVAFEGRRQATVINQAPFSFDLSVMDLMLAWATGSRLVHIDRDHILRLADLFTTLAESDADAWVSTPSFADLCLASDEFNETLLPHLRIFLFCGETLPHATAARLRERFPSAAVINTYGPTESTVAVTSIKVDEQVLRDHPTLPVGATKPGSVILILGPDGSPLPEGEKGEIVIGGDTVSMGYYRRDDLTERAFARIDTPAYTGWAYRTGDAGFQRDGQLFFAGRLDFQVKLHGYRIEIEDIEANLRELPGVLQAVVVPRYAVDSPTTVTSLHAVVQPTELPTGSTLSATVALKRVLRERLPDYMIPKTMSFVAEIPMTPNGKADRAAVAAMTA